MKKIINTTSDAIEVNILGSQYRLEPKGFLIVSTAVADYWHDTLHKFLEVEDFVEVSKKEVKEVEVESTDTSKVKKIIKK